MKYNFDKIIDRINTNSTKWDRDKNNYPKETIPMWVADMDFQSCSEVVEALKERLDHPIYGYTYPPDSAYKSIINKLKKTYKWEVKKEWIVFIPGVIESIYSCIRYLTNVGDNILIQEPVYGPYRFAIRNCGRNVLCSDLKIENGRYVMDYEKLHNVITKKDRKTISHRTKISILCNPHNPVGTVFTKNELIKFGNECINNNVLIISDEVHCDIVYKPNKHIPFASICKKFENNSITFMSPNKPFNISGIGQSYAIIPNKIIRSEFVNSRLGCQWGNTFGIIALEAAYNKGEDYLNQLREYLNENINIVDKFFKEKLSFIKVFKSEGTYMLWIDMRNLKISEYEINNILINKAKIRVDLGSKFGEKYKGFIRLNIACSRELLNKILNNIEISIRENLKL